MAWAPTAADVQATTPGRIIADDNETAAWISEAASEVVAEVGYFDADRVINPAADLADRVTLGSLARTAATLRAAYFAERRSPEQMNYGEFQDGGSNQGRELHARYLDALARLRMWIRTPDGSNPRSSPRIGSVALTTSTPQPRLYGSDAALYRGRW